MSKITGKNQGKQIDEKNKFRIWVEKPQLTIRRPPKKENREKNMEIEMNSNFIKTSVLNYARFKRGWNCCTEFSAFSGIADVMIVDGQERFIEVEVKISKADFLADFKKSKHQMNNKPWKFYFAIPVSMREWALKQLKGKPYGLMIVTGIDSFVDNVRIVKNAKKLNDGKQSSSSYPFHKNKMHYFYHRMCNELVSTKRMLYSGGINL